MATHDMTGSRIRERRLDQGLRQADLAEAAGISASYLNLIEHNKRRIGGKLLSHLAQALDISAAALSQGADAGVLDGMQAAAARGGHKVETDRAEDLATRFPGWAGLIAAQDSRIDTLEGEMRMLRDRMTHDPALADALHNVITAVTAIQATAGILTSDDTIDADWQRRFHDNILGDSQRLAAESESLVAYLEAPQADKTPPDLVVGFEAVETFLMRETKLLDWIEAHPATPAETLLNDYGAAGLATDVRALLIQHLTQFGRDAQAMPRADFTKAAIAANCDPAVLAAQFDVGLAAVLRRLANLPAQLGLPPMGLAVGDATGALTYLKQIPGFAPSRHTASCPLWPLTTALSQPARPIKAEVALPGQGGARFLCYAIATPKTAPGFDAAPVYESTMLVISDPEPGWGEPIPVGVSCRICARQKCAARREPSVIASAVAH